MPSWFLEIDAVKQSSRMDPITSFIVMDILESAMEMQKSGVDIVHLEVGEPDLPPPAAVIEAVCRAARDGQTHYTHSLGMMPLREAIADWYRRYYNVSVEAERVIVTPGTSGAFLNTIAVLLDPGEKLLLTDPGYPCYPNFARLLCVDPYPLPLEAGDRFLPRREAVLSAIEKGVAAALIASPANPTGALLPPDLLKWLASLPIPLISDEIYHGLVYGGEAAHTALEYSDQVIVINGLSKRLAMTGMRIGWAIVPSELTRSFQKLNQNIFICADSLSQHAAICALSDPSCQDEAARMAQTYARRRAVLMAGVKQIGFKLHYEPAGAFYIFADVSAYSNDGFEFARKMLEEARVAITPGVDFGQHNTSQFVRLSYTVDESRIEEAISRIRRWLGV
jgi:(5-formylfuran-3-yl)methyl phosphate transaminase